MADLMELAQQFGLPEHVLSVFRDKGVTSISTLVKTFEDDEQFADFVAEEVQKKTGSASKRLRLALKMVYMDAVQKARSRNIRPKMSSSPVSSSATSRAESENGEEEEEAFEDEEDIPPPPPPPPPPPEGPAWRP
ncbi:ATP-dependent zinc metalloprotease FTSH 10 [Durusdinium trenchii]|uniref:Mitochondrial n=1 Tax=Durusdinium trenchii TaxID=1381693 RepID=A0ABP0PI60_9DINO